MKPYYKYTDWSMIIFKKRKRIGWVEKQEMYALRKKKIEKEKNKQSDETVIDNRMNSQPKL